MDNTIFSVTYNDGGWDRSGENFQEPFWVGTSPEGQFQFYTKDDAEAWVRAEMQHYLNNA
jgi:hypothetical protein